ncbi:MAG TPA: hypothetical protein VK878_06440 [Candidatus Deferrimicrobiaceae bacterium]|nr:hypothetical protein [Candidatus Deferrimicrobiaceae bacterium]
MLAELLERDATGRLAVIYDEIRRLWAVPYVSSLQRHLATRPGWLEWTWAALGPAFTRGIAQVAAWRAAEGLAVPRLASLSRDALAVWGVDAAGEAAIRAACASFVRVSPVNLVLSGLLRRLLTGERPAAAVGAPSRWTAPAPLGPLPPLAAPAALPPAERAVLATLGTTVAGQVFVPGLYRMLASWPGFLAHVATVLRPHLDDAATRAAGQRLLAAVDAEIPAVFATLPPLPDTPAMPPAAEFADVLAALDTYRKTSPEMVVFGRMLGDALPKEIA